jgi:hypothetical protein
MARVTGKNGHTEMIASIPKIMNSENCCARSLCWYRAERKRRARKRVEVMLFMLNHPLLNAGGRLLMKQPNKKGHICDRAGTDA